MYNMILFTYFTFLTSLVENLQMISANIDLNKIICRVYNQNTEKSFINNFLLLIRSLIIIFNKLISCIILFIVRISKHKQF